MTDRGLDSSGSEQGYVLCCCEYCNKPSDHSELFILTKACGQMF
jgi:hypothetical protein